MTITYFNDTPSLPAAGMLLEEEQQTVSRTPRWRKNRILWIGLALVPLVWLLDVVVDTAFFSEETHWEALFHPEPAVVWMRSLVCAVIAGFTLYAAHVLRKLERARNTAEEALVAREVAQREWQVRDRELQERDRELRLVLESTSEGIIGVDVQGNCRVINRAAMELLECRTEDALGKNLHDLVHRPSLPQHPKQACPLLQGVRAGNLARYENEIFFRPNGGTLKTETTSAPLIEDGVITGAVITFTDIGARKMLERQLDDANRIGTLGRLAANVAHEFNNVLMGAQPFAELLLRTDSTPKTQTSARQIIQSIARGKRITEEILRFARPAEVEAKPILIQEWLGALSQEISGIVAPRELVLRTPEEPLYVAGDRLQLMQVLVNLVRNACDAMPTGGTLTIAAEPVYSYQRFAFGAVTTPDRFVHITIHDTGHGIPADVLPHIFEPLFTTKKNRGTGLGLAIAQQVVTRHAGHLFVESTVGRGTSFHLLIPSTVPVVAAESVTTTSATVSTASGRILLVEDDVDVGAGIVAILEEAGLTVTRAATGKAALDAVGLELPDAVVLDIGLPDMDGTEVYRGMAARFPELPVVFSTGHGDESKLGDLVGQKHVFFLRKPYDAATLIKSLAVAMR